MPPDTTPLDEFLIDVATYLEPSDRDRAVAENRYRLLKDVLDRPTSPFRDLLNQDGALIYAQGSVATSTVIINGADADRFDVDAIVQCRFPLDWTPEYALDQLYEVLKNFPGAEEVERCTRCVQIRFAFMHLDVTLLDRNGPFHINHAGEIFHSPDDGGAYRVPANPYGFGVWFRENAGTPARDFIQRLDERRKIFVVDRLVSAEAERAILADAEQEDLPAFLPARLDTPKALSLKLLKRFLNLQYADLDRKRPPSIYLARVCGDVSEVRGLTQQLIALAMNIESRLQTAITARRKVHEVNPTYEPDVITDRWPQSIGDMEVLAGRLHHLVDSLNAASHLSLKGIVEVLEELFGETVGEHVRKLIKESSQNRDGKNFPYIAVGTGAVSQLPPSDSVSRYRQPPPHNFHCGWKKK
ncbi:MAG: nucleotidyltransferase [Maricaulaceae bacterium]|nr:nucleotidyltransferase [Maricaulaceae bacterium]